MEDLNDVFWNTVNRYYSLKEEDDKKDNPKCVICYQNGNSIFSVVADENRKLIATCKNKNPCNIEIIIPPFKLLTKELGVQTQKIETLQNKIIEIKNEFIFGFTTEEQTVETFQQLKTNLNEAITKSEQLFELLVSIKPDETKINEYKKQRDELIALYKSSITEYKTTKSMITLERAIAIYKDILSKNDEIMKSTYIYNNVEEENGQYKLIQKELPIDFIEIVEGELVKNIEMNKYIQVDTTRKKPVLDKSLILEEVEEEVEEEEESPKIKIKIIPETDILERELQKANDLIESNPKISAKKILETYVTNFFFKKEEGRCLSNFWECDIIVDDREYPSGECCFHGEKFYRLGMISKGKRKEDLIKYSEKFLKGTCKEKGDAVKKQGRGFMLTPGELELWAPISIDVQKEICKYKYENYEEVQDFLCKTTNILIHPALRCNEEQTKTKMWEGKAVVVDDKLMVLGKNMLGNLWMEQRLECP